MSEDTVRNSNQDLEGVTQRSTLEPVLEKVIPIIEEQLQVGKRVVETGTVRLQRHSIEHVESLELPLETVSWSVERVAKNEPVNEVPAPRHEGDYIFYPVVEERVVITRQLVLVEEVRISRNVTHEQKKIDVSLRRDELIVERQSSTGRTV